MLTRRFWAGALIFWCAFGLVAGTQVWISMIHHGHFVPLLLSYFVVGWAVWALFTAVIVVLTHRFPVVPAWIPTWTAEVFAGFEVPSRRRLVQSR